MLRPDPEGACGEEESGWDMAAERLGRRMGAEAPRQAGPAWGTDGEISTIHSWM